MKPGDACRARPRTDVVRRLADPDRLGAATSGTRMPTDVAADDEQDAEVEQRRAEPQQPALVQLAGARRPAELVVAVAPDVAADEDRDAPGTGRSTHRTRSRRAHRRRLPCTPAGRTVPARPPRPAARCGQARSARSQVPWRGVGQHGADGVERVDVRRAARRPARPEQFDPGPVLGRAGAARLPGRRRGELADDGEVVGQFAGDEARARRPVGVGEPQQRHAALAGVAVGVIGQVEAAAAAQVEGVDVVAAAASASRRLRQVLDEAAPAGPRPRRAARAAPCAAAGSRPASSSSG